VSDVPPAIARHRSRALPEVGAGGYSRLNGSVEFHLRVNSLLGPDDVVVDFGAGRGQHTEDELPFRRDLLDRRGKVARLVGLDVDPVVLENPSVDEAHVIVPGEKLPLADDSVDLVVSDFTFEHVDDPLWAGEELGRVVRPGGWICARTPNRWGQIALPARLVPNRLHDAVLARVQPTKQERDTFPTRYRLNTPAALRRAFPPERFSHHSYTHESEPAYAGNSPVAWTLLRGLAAVTPPPVRSMHLIFLRKRGDGT
jgi:SAM-dependent methyltransferase